MYRVAPTRRQTFHREHPTPGRAGLESPDAGEVSKQPGTVAKLALAYDTLRTESLGGRASRDLIRRVAQEWKP